MKPFEQLFDSAAAHRLYLNWFHQDYDGGWRANWRLPGHPQNGFRVSTIVTGDDGFETLSRSLMIAIAELRPEPKGRAAFW